ncbi:MAG: isochorismate synthase [Halodesulfurarchaeum sp.]
MAEHRPNRPGPFAIPTAYRAIGPVGLQEAVFALSEASAVWSPPAEPTVIAVGREAVITGVGRERFETIKADGTELLDRVETADLPDLALPRLLGGFGFFDEQTLDPPWTAFDPAAFTLPRIQVVSTGERTHLTGIASGAEADRLDRVAERLESASPEDRPPGQLRTGHSASKPDRQPTAAGSSQRSATREAFLRDVERLRSRIESGPLEKAVLAAAVERPVDSDQPIADVLEALDARYPETIKFSFAGSRGLGPEVFFGATPERLLEKRGRHGETEALAGTIGRGATPSADRELKDELRQNDRIDAEHDFVANHIESRLAKAEARVEVGERRVRTLANVHHLQTPIDVSLPAETHVLDVVEALHPTPAVGGHPAEQACAFIRETEHTPRGWYASPVGWFDASGDGTFAVAIRSALRRDDRATLFAGNGIVAGSDPATEWEELLAKLEPLEAVLQ